jgi:hypothetical protein
MIALLLPRRHRRLAVCRREFFLTRDSRKSERFMLKGIGPWKVGSKLEGHIIMCQRRFARRIENLIKPAPTIIFRCLAYWVGSTFLPCLAFPEE